MSRGEVTTIVRGHWDELSALGVKRLRLFGSVALDQAGPESDVDLLVT
jgi:predicted nucleotidyltransferase